MTNRIFVAVACLLALFACNPKATQSVGREDTTVTTTSTEQLEVVAFYNVENLFDATDDLSNTGDDEWLPDAPKSWTDQRYRQKLTRLARVVLDLGGTASSGGPAMLGVCEVENKQVLLDLADEPLLANSKYQVAHIESSDFRGIDCAVMYRSDRFTLAKLEAIQVKLPLEADGSQRTTRDIVMAHGSLDGDSITVFVNHWPSRYGGQARSKPGRAAAARVLREQVDKILASAPNTDIVIMGDLNDDPSDESVVTVLGTTPLRREATAAKLYNPMQAMHAQGIGSLTYRGKWNLFDQIIVSPGLATPSENWSVQQVSVLRTPYLVQAAGESAGSPLRTYEGDNFRGGYSDHLPVYAILTRPKE